MGELHDLTALEQGAAVRAGEVSPLELVEHCAERIARLDGGLGAFVTLTVEAARAQAREPLPDGPLAGVPTAVKDLNAVAGVPTGYGSRAFAGFVPSWSRLGRREAAGGRHDLARQDRHPRARAALLHRDRRRSARPQPVGPGALAGREQRRCGRGRGRRPGAGRAGVGRRRLAAHPGLGLRPRRAQARPRPDQRGPVAGDLTGLSTNGPLARTVRDAAALLDVMAGPMPGDPHWASPPAASFLSACDRPPGRLRVGRTCTPVVPGAVVHPDVLAAYEQASQLLAGLGHEVEDVPPPYGPDLLPAFEVLWSVSAAVAPVPPEAEDLLRPLTRWLRAKGRATTALEFTRATASLQAATRRGVQATAAYDVLLLPTVAQPPALLGAFSDGADPAEEFARMARWTPFTAVFNTTGQPAVSLPLGESAEGLPIGVMLVGRPADEVTLLRLSAQVEQAQPWATATRPPGRRERPRQGGHHPAARAAARGGRLLARWQAEPASEFDDLAGGSAPQRRDRPLDEPPVGAGTLAVTDGDGVLLGTVGWRQVVHGPNQGSTALNIGISLRPHGRGAGHGTRAQRMLADYLFASFPVHRLEASTDVDNVPEQRALAGAGFLREGVLRGAQWRHGAWHDLVAYSRLRTDPRPGG